MAQSSALRRKLERLGVQWPEEARARLIPATEDGVARLVDSLRSILGERGHESGALRRFAERCEAALEKHRAGRGITDVPVKPFWVVPPLTNTAFARNPVGDLNLLMRKVSLVDPAPSAILRTVATTIIEEVGGVRPDEFGVFEAWNDGESEPRITVKWNINRAPKLKDLTALYRIAKDNYAEEVRGPREKGRGWEEVTVGYHLNGNLDPRRFGVYFGPDSAYDSHSRGILMSRVFRSRANFQVLRQHHPVDWLCRTVLRDAPNSFTVELREGHIFAQVEDSGLQQASYLAMVVQIAYYLKNDALIEPRTLAIRIYNELNRVGLGPSDQHRLYGMEAVLRTIERVLLLPFLQSGLATQLRFEPESILLAGIKGNGKTLLAEHLIACDYNCIFVAIEAMDLLIGLKSEERGSQFLMQLDRIASGTGLPVVLTVDDIDMVADERDPTFVSRLLALMKGVRQRGFFMLTSSNHPDRIDSRLLEPGRLSRVVYVPLPDLAARRGVLTNHLCDRPFQSDAERRRIIERMAKKTEGWTQRFLWELVQEAGRWAGLRLTSGNTHKVSAHSRKGLLTAADFIAAFESTSSCIDVPGLREWDRHIQQFVRAHSGEIGFGRKEEER